MFDPWCRRPGLRVGPHSCFEVIRIILVLDVLVILFWPTAFSINNLGLSRVAAHHRCGRSVLAERFRFAQALVGADAHF